MKYHELSRYFPMLPKDEFEQLVDSIQRFGQLEPITLLDGKILDGRNRYEVCMKLNIEPAYREYEPDGHEPLDFVLAANMRRRHLTEAQKAQIIIDIEGVPEPMSKEEATQRREEIAGRSEPRERDAPSYIDLAEEAGVSSQTIARVAEVQENEELVAELREGNVTAYEAQREHRARQGMRPVVSATRASQYDRLDEVKWILEYINSWTRKVDDFIEAIEEDKFSPEAARFTSGRVRKLRGKLIVFEEALDDQTS